MDGIDGWVQTFLDWNTEDRSRALKRLSEKVFNFNTLLQELDHLESSSQDGSEVYGQANALDFISKLPSSLSIRTVELLDGTSLLHGSCVCRFWKQTMYNDSVDHVWQREFISTWPSSTLSLNVEGSRLNWRETWHRSLLCREQWLHGQIGKTEYHGHTDRVRHVRVRGKRFVSASWDGTLRFGDCETARVGESGSTKRLAEHSGSIFGVWFDGTVVATCSEDHTIKIWHLDWEKCITELKGHEGPVYRLELINSEILVSCSYDFIGVWHWPSAELLHKLIGHKHDVHRLKVCNDYIVSGSYDETIRVWSYPSCTLQWNSPPVHRGGVSCLHLSGNVVASGSAKGEIHLFNLANGKMLFRDTERHHGALVTSIWVEVKRNMFITSSIISFRESGGYLCIWELDSKR